MHCRNLGCTHEVTINLVAGDCIYRNAVTLNSEMDFYLRNGRNGDFLYEMELQNSINSLSRKIFYLKIKVGHT